jgi:hypothetical protein
MVARPVGVSQHSNTRRACEGQVPSVGLIWNGGHGKNTIYAGQAPDYIAGDSGNTTIDGGRGDDRLLANDGITGAAEASVSHEFSEGASTLTGTSSVTLSNAGGNSSAGTTITVTRNTVAPPLFVTSVPLAISAAIAASFPFSGTDQRCGDAVRREAVDVNRPYDEQSTGASSSVALNLAGNLNLPVDATGTNVPRPHVHRKAISSPISPIGSRSLVAVDASPGAGLQAAGRAVPAVISPMRCTIG